MGAGSGAEVRREADGIAEVVLARPQALNALNTGTLTVLVGLFTELAADPQIRVVVLSAAGERAFCVGADLKERAAMTDEQLMAQRLVFRATFGALLGLPQPVIAAVNGFALGGGCELALSCDVIVADQTAVFGLPEVTVGLVPGCGGTQLAARRIGPGRAADLVLSGRKFDAAEAGAIGLADRVVEAGAAREQALELARQIAANSPVAVRAAKRALRNGAGLGLAAALDVEDAAWRTAAGSADRREGIAAFAQKRRPLWPSAQPVAAAGRASAAGPAGPAAPADPAGPAGPAAPAGPAGPVAPAGLAASAGSAGSVDIPAPADGRSAGGV